MHCPSCHKEIIGPSSNCVSCGHAFGADMSARLALYFDLKKEAEQVKELVKGDLWTRVKDVVTRVERFGELIEIDLAGSRFRTGAEQTQPDKEVREPWQEQPQPGPAPQKTLPPVPPKVSVPRPAPATAKHEPGQFEVKFGQKWLLIIGIVTMVFGVGYFLKYSFEQGWIGPAGRVSLAYLWGIAFLAAGNIFRKRDFETFGLYLAGGGIATLYFSTFAAFQIYHLIPQEASFLVMVMVTLLAGVLAVIYDTKWLAILGIAGGFLTPVLLSTGQDNQLVLMTYVTILNLGLLGIAFWKKWDLLNVVGFFFTYLLYAAWFSTHYHSTKFWPSIVFLNLFYLIYSVIPFAYQFFRKQSEKMEGFLIILPNSLLAFGFGYAMITQYASLEWVGVLTVSYAFMFLAMATWLARAGKQDQDAFVVLVSKAALFLVITIPVIFSKHWITVFWAAQAVVLLWSGLRLQRKAVLASAYALVAVSAGKFFLYDYEAVFRLHYGSPLSSSPFEHMVIERLLTSLAVLAALLFFARRTADEELTLASGSRGSDSALFHAAFGISLFVVLNKEVHLFFGSYLPAARFAAISVLWTIFSVVLMMLGFRKSSPVLRKVSLGLFAVTLVKVFLFDMENVSTPYRIISFIILGLVLVATSYLYHRFKDRLISAMSADKS